MPIQRIPVFYSTGMLLNLRTTAPQFVKPAMVVADWQSHLLPIDIEHPDEDDSVLRRVHDRDYVRHVMAGHVENGFGTRDGFLAQELRFPIDAMVAAAKAINGGAAVACAPFAGFSHAHYKRSEAWCTFNGLVAAAHVLADRGPVGILDFDAAYGNGTADMLQRRSRLPVVHVSAGERFHGPDQATAFMDAIRPMVRHIIYSGCRSVVYQASANQHRDDPAGSMLTTEQLSERDRIVFSWFADAGVPVL